MKRKFKPGFLTVDRAAQLVGVTHWTVRKWLQQSKLTRFKRGRTPLVNRRELLEMLKPTKVEGRP